MDQLPIIMNHHQGQQIFSRRREKRTWSFEQQSVRIIDFRDIIPAQTDLEIKLLDLPELQKGFNFWVKGAGHPEGRVGLHVKEVLNNIDVLDINNELKSQLRIVALVHDVFKNQEHKTTIAGKRIHHGVLARSFFKKYIKNKIMLSLIEYHDEPFYAWRDAAIHNAPKSAEQRLNKLMSIFQNHLQLLFWFFYCDTMTGNKIRTPIYWFAEWMKNTKSRSKYTIDDLSNRCNNLRESE